MLCRLNGRPLLHAIAVETAPRRRNYNFRLRLQLSEPFLSIEQLRTVRFAFLRGPLFFRFESWSHHCETRTGALGLRAQRRWDVSTTQALARSLQSRAHLDRMHTRLLMELLQTAQDVARAQARAVLSDLRAHAVVRVGDRLSQLSDTVRRARAQRSILGGEPDLTVAIPRGSGRW